MVGLPEMTNIFTVNTKRCRGYVIGLPKQQNCIFNSPTMLIKDQEPDFQNLRFS